MIMNGDSNKWESVILKAHFSFKLSAATEKHSHSNQLHAEPLKKLQNFYPPLPFSPSVYTSNPCIECLETI